MAKETLRQSEDRVQEGDPQGSDLDDWRELDPYRVAGRVLSSRYRLLRPLRSGGMGHVFAARDLLGDHDVAIKILRSELVNERSVSRFMLEARTGLKLAGCQQIVRVEDVGFTPGLAPYLVMELLEGRDLAQLIRLEGALEPARSIEIFVELCRGVAALHEEGSIHRDLKPSNVFVLHDGGVRLIDLGICKALETQHELQLTKTGELIGSLLYLPPERLRDPDDSRIAGDVWALAVILYEMLAGLSPFAGDDQETVRRRISTQDVAPLKVENSVCPELDTVLGIALNKNPQERYPSVLSLAAAAQRAAFDAGLVDAPGLESPSLDDDPDEAVDEEDQPVLEAETQAEPVKSVEPDRDEAPRPVAVKRGPLLWGGSAVALGALVFVGLGGLGRSGASSAAEPAGSVDEEPMPAPAASPAGETSEAFEIESSDAPVSGRGAEREGGQAPAARPDATRRTPGAKRRAKKERTAPERPAPARSVEPLEKPPPPPPLATAVVSPPVEPNAADQGDGIVELDPSDL